MVSLLHLHVIALVVIYLNVLIFKKNILNDLGSKYFFINYIYHNHKKISCFLITYPFFIILIYYLQENIFLLSSFFVSILHVYFLYEITSKKNINKREAYIAWYKQNVKHSLSMHSYDISKKDFNFLNEKLNLAILFKFEIILYLCIVVESEVMYEVISYFRP
ncbi:hypothetical protein [Halarcobacter sp.]|uniref:hypothetical protein n=1 Tax=Halarcobacter sp. TaxID=2321133 RepID=UPI0029F4F7C9|nr:hypothetical protein [Halarcobacter sp.]